MLLPSLLESSQKSSPIYSVFIILSLVVLLGACVGRPDNTVWHQHYEPVEDLHIHKFVQDAFAEAQQYYGKSEFSVHDIHIRQSVFRKDRFLLSRADISNFSELSRQIFFNKDDSPEDLIWDALTAETRNYVKQAALGTELSVTGKQQVVTGLNTLIESYAFYQDLVLFESGKEGREEEILPLSELSGSEKYIRNFLDNHFLHFLLPIPQKRYALEGVEVCECLSPANNVCILYVSAEPGSPDFFPQLAHEVFHLLSPQSFDWYVEGLCNVFAEEYCAQHGCSWQSVLAGLHARKTTDPYAISYFMMRDIYNIVGPHLANFMKFAVWSDKDKTRKYIDIISWLNTLPPEMMDRVEKTIWSYSPSLKAYKGSINSFMLPQ